MQMRGWGVRKYDIFSFGRQMGLHAKNYKNPPSSLFLGINGVNLITTFLLHTQKNGTKTVLGEYPLENSTIFTTWQCGTIKVPLPSKHLWEVIGQTMFAG